ncbi:MAG: hypothetical protein QNJ67_12570 [Kiloniellales bacterium]|nr:hypothetical protein [Kiloniellales bacterium]
MIKIRDLSFVYPSGAGLVLLAAGFADSAAGWLLTSAVPAA